MNYYLYLKALHIVFMVTWFAGLFYIVRLYIYIREADSKEVFDKSIIRSQLLIMAKRLWYIITWPGMILTFISGFYLVFLNPELVHEKWFHIKMTLLLILIAYHLYSGVLLKKADEGTLHLGSTTLRLYNELPTVLLFGIVFLAVLKSEVSFLYSFLFVFIMAIAMMAGVFIYGKLRKDS